VLVNVQTYSKPASISFWVSCKGIAKIQNGSFVPVHRAVLLGCSNLELLQSILLSLGVTVITMDLGAIFVG